jgi:hypothetical protein
VVDISRLLGYHDASVLGAVAAVSIDVPHGVISQRMRIHTQLLENRKPHVCKILGFQGGDYEE